MHPSTEIGRMGFKILIAHNHVHGYRKSNHRKHAFKSKGTNLRAECRSSMFSRRLNVPGMYRITTSQLAKCMLYVSVISRRYSKRASLCVWVIFKVTVAAY